MSFPSASPSVFVFYPDTDSPDSPETESQISPAHMPLRCPCQSLSWVYSILNFSLFLFLSKEAMTPAAKTNGFSLFEWRVTHRVCISYQHHHHRRRRRRHRRSHHSRLLLFVSILFRRCKLPLWVVTFIAVHSVIASCLPEWVRMEFSEITTHSH